MKWLYIVSAIILYMVVWNYIESKSWWKPTDTMEIIQSGVER